MKREERKSF